MANKFHKDEPEVQNLPKNEKFPHPRNFSQKFPQASEVKWSKENKSEWEAEFQWNDVNEQVGPHMFEHSH